MADQEDVFRESIERNLPRLVRSTEVTTTLLINLLSREVIDGDEREIIESEKTPTGQKTKLYEILKNRPENVNTVIEIFRRVKQNVPANILQECSNFMQPVAAPTTEANLPSVTGSGTEAREQPSVPASATGSTTGTLQVIQPTPIPRQTELQPILPNATVTKPDAVRVDQSPSGAHATSTDRRSGVTAQSILQNYHPERYKSGNEFKGLALIVNIITFANEPEADRIGAEQDSKRLKEVLSGQNFLICEVTNPTKNELTSMIDEFQQLFAIWSVDSCLIAVMSHGKDQGRIFTSDVQTFSLWRDLVAKFNNKDVKCDKLKGLPKIFLFNYCRGDETDRGATTAHDALPYKESPSLIPTWTDMLVCYSTLEGHYSYRNPSNDHGGGSWFVQTFCDVVERYSKDYDVLVLLKIVSQLMRLAVGDNEEKQICPYYNIGFDKEFYFSQ